MRMKVLGQMQGGKKLFALAETGEEAEIGKGTGDIVRRNVFLLESFDKSFATSVSEGIMRLFCLNQLQNPFAMRSGDPLGGGSKVKRRHSQVWDNLDVRADLAGQSESFAAFVESANAMTQVRMTQDMRTRFFAKLYAPEAFVNSDNWQRSAFDLFDESKVTQNKRNNIADLLNFADDSLGSTSASANGTLYGALNAVTFYQDHEARTKAGKRWESAMIGSGNRKKADALELALTVLA
jgi:hypothetical protein